MDNHKEPRVTEQATLDKLEAILKDALMWVAGATCERRIQSALAVIAQARIAWTASSEAPTLTECLNAPDKIDSYARQLAMSLWRTHYRLASPNFELLNDTYGVLSQIDNMITGFAPATRQAVPADPIMDVLCSPPYAAPDLYARLVRFCREELPLAQQQGKVKEWVEAVASAAEHEAEKFGYCARQAAPEAPTEIVFDRGPWRYSSENGKHFVESADSTHDVRLYINGDFAHAEDREAYGEMIAHRLNAAPATQQAGAPERTKAQFLAAERAGVSFSTQEKCWNAWFGVSAEPPAFSPEAAATTASASTGTAVRNAIFPGPSIGEVLAAKDREIADLRAALAQQGAAQASQGADEQSEVVPPFAAPASQHDVDFAALRLVQKLSTISMRLAADLVGGADYTFQGNDYLDRNSVVDRVMEWRNEWDATFPAREELARRCRAQRTDKDHNENVAAQAAHAGAVDETAIRTIVTKAREFYLGYLSRHIPGDDIDAVRADVTTDTATRAIAFDLRAAIAAHATQQGENAIRQ